MVRSKEGKRTRRPEIRTRTGCWKCRERRVKCPEQRPICRHCERLGFVCAYDYRLTWQSVYVHDQQPPSTPARRRPPARNGWHRIFQWMFLNTGYDDFHALPTSKHAGGASSTYSDTTSEIETLTTISTPAVPSPLSLTRASTPLTPWNGSEPDQSLALFPPSRSLSPLPLANHHTYLWEYFDKCITPQCVINTLINPYRDILLRVAASSPDGPLLHCILAVSANELHNLGNSTFKTTIWDHRARALNLLRREVEVDSLGASWGLTSRTSQAQVLLSTLMLCFFEITQDCSESWTFHSNFVRSYLVNNNIEGQIEDEEQQSIVQFAADYFSYHDILAATALPAREPLNWPDNRFRQTDSAVESFTGCRTELLNLIDEISRLATLDQDESSREDRRMQRNAIERRLHDIAEPALDLEDENAVIAETKRLAALIYLYSRIDNAGPQDTLLERPTRRILELMPSISMRTNALLWPLFIVATLGMRPEWEEDRMFLLERLSALQDTRQLGNVKKARKVIEDVWKARDISRQEALKGWTILRNRHGALSLA